MAFTIEQITEILNGVVELKKGILNKVDFTLISAEKKKIYERPMLADYYPGYEQSCRRRERILVHAQEGVIPYTLLDARSPNQTEKERDYLIENYKQTTLSTYQDFIASIQRGFLDSNYSIDYADNDTSAESFQGYLEEGIQNTPINCSLDEFMREVAPPTKFIDAMGVIAVRPATVEYTTDEVGNIIVSGTTVDPYPQYYTCEQVVWYDDHDGYLIETNEKSMVEFRGKQTKMGIVYEFYDRENIWRIKQVGRFIEFRFEAEVYYPHGLGYVPVVRLRGIPTFHEGKTLWISPFLYATPPLDQVVLDESWLNASKANCVYPYRVMVGDPCKNKKEFDGEYMSCEGGYFRLVSGPVRCESCLGTGKLSRMSPIGELIISNNSENPLGENDGGIKPSEAISFVSPSTETLVFLREEIEKNTLKGKSILHLKTTNTVVKGAEDTTAAGMFMDEKAKIVFVKTPIDQLFSIYRFLINTIGEMRYGEAFENIKPKLNEPTTYDFKTEGEYLDEIARLISINAPPILIHDTMLKFLKSMYYTEESANKVLSLIVAADRILTLPNSEITIRLSKGLISVWEVLLHDSSHFFIKDLIRDDPGFLDKELAEQKNLLIQKAKNEAARIKSETPTVLTSANVVDSILNRNNADAA